VVAVGGADRHYERRADNQEGKNETNISERKFLFFSLGPYLVGLVLSERVGSFPSAGNHGEALTGC
jgi:hypothetical protein